MSEARRTKESGSFLVNNGRGLLWTRDMCMQGCNSYAIGDLATMPSLCTLIQFQERKTFFSYVITFEFHFIIIIIIIIIVMRLVPALLYLFLGLSGYHQFLSEFLNHPFLSLYPIFNILLWILVVREIKSKRLRWAGHIARVKKLECFKAFNS